MDLPAILIVLGGTLAATIVNFSVSGLSKCGPAALHLGRRVTTRSGVDVRHVDASGRYR